MPFKCCVHHCKGKGPKFSFPKEDIVKNKWLRALGRMDIVDKNINNYKVCELHFREDDVEKSLKLFNEETRQSIEVPLERPRLKQDAMDTLQKQLRDFTNETVLSTPKPRASSTTQKPLITKKVTLNKVPLVYSPNTSSNSAESLGILSVDNIQLASGLDAAECQNIRPSQVTNSKLQQQRSLANSILQKSTPKGFGLSSRYLRLSDTIKDSSEVAASNSTVNETDLLQPAVRNRLSFTPESISTPRSLHNSDVSDISSTSLNWLNASNNLSMSKNIAQFSQHVRNSNLSIAQLCDQFYHFSSIGSNMSQFACSEESFVPGELAGEKMAERELSWRRDQNILGENLRSDSLFSQMDLSKEQSISVTEFFQKRSELADICLKDSPEKNTAPMPLIDKSVSFESIDESMPISLSADESILSITEMEKAISAGDNTTRIANYIETVVGKQSTKGSNEGKRSSNTKQQTSYSQIENDFKENLHPVWGDSNFQMPSPVPPATYRTTLKETTYYENSHDKSSSSMNTANSLESLTNGKLPIETNRIELVWGCVRISKKKAQAFILRNKSQSKLRLQIASSNTSFRIVSSHSDSESVSVLPILMYPSESRAFSVIFTPSAIGAVVGKLNFSPISTELQLQQTKRQQLMLYGYGGHSNVEIENVLKDTNMKMWLSLGKLEHRSQLFQKFTVRNPGSVAAFVCINFGSKALYGYSKVTIFPTELVLQPKERIVVTVTYTPTKEDAEHLFLMSPNQVIEIGYVHIITGEEPVRGRIRRLCRKLKQEAGMVSNPLQERLSGKFPNEKMPSDLTKFTETVGSMKTLMQTFESKEIILTLEMDSESTLMGQIDGIDETSMFQSLTEGMVTVLNNRTLAGSCMIEPSKLVLTPPTKREDFLLITSQSATSLQFQIAVTPRDVLQIAPVEGILPSGETALIKISCDMQRLQQQVFKIQVFVDDEMFEVDVKVIFMKFTST